MTGVRRAIIVLAVALSGITLPLYAWKVAEKSDYTDFRVYHRAAGRAAAGDWARIYDFRSDGGTPYRYAPPSLLLVRPFAASSETSARVAWFLLQFLGYAAGFHLLARALRVLRQDAPLVTAVSLLFVLRYCLDSFTIGQVTGVMFAGLGISFWAWVMKRPGLAAAGLFLPTLLKIGPGVIYGPLLATPQRAGSRRRVVLAALASLGLTSLAVLIWSGGIETSNTLWRAWWDVVVHDGDYFDASHYGSQSIKSALLRLAGAGFFDREAANALWGVFTLVICGATAGFWGLRSPASARGRALFFALGIFPYLWCMPETFKYAMTFLAVPIAMLLTRSDRHPRSRLSYAALGFGALTLSLAGKDLVGDALFFGLQKASIPFLAGTLLGVAVWREAWRESALSPFTRSLLAFVRGVVHGVRPRPLGPWPRMPAREGTLEATLLAAYPSGAGRAETRRFERALKAHITRLEAEYGGDFEVLAIPYRDHELAASGGPLSPGRGAALRAGFCESKGRTILIPNLLQPCEPEFFSRARVALRDGADLVRGNRRLPGSRFEVPVRHLPLVFGRHRMGLLFNRVVRFLFPVRTTDTHSGTFALSRRLALRAFAAQVSPDFLFGLEATLTAIAHELRDVDLPVELSLEREKSGFRVLFETTALLFGLPLIFRRFRLGCYHPGAPGDQITADDWGISPAVNEGILELARQGVIRRVSLMGNSTYLENGLRELAAVPGIELGLHFTLTHGEPSPGAPSLIERGAAGGASYFSPRALLVRWVLGKARVEDVRATLRLQLGRVERAGVKLCYLDGHHHIHLLPGLIDLLADTLREHGIRRVRLPYDPGLWLSAKAPLNVLALLASRSVARQGFRSERCFYPRERHFLDFGLLRASLARRRKEEVIVHPAARSDLAEVPYGDVYSDGRVTEYRALRMLTFDA